MTPQLDRRSFLRQTGMAAAAIAVTGCASSSSSGQAPAVTSTPAPSRKLNIAAIGFGGVGGSNVKNSADENIVALCDVDFGYVDRRLAGRDKNRDGTPRPLGVRLGEQFGTAVALNSSTWRPRRMSISSWSTTG